jgi:hypothetical protein
MRGTFAGVIASVAQATFFLNSTFADVPIAVIDSTDRGWYDVEGDHAPTNISYALGDWRGPDCQPSTGCHNDFRNFFVFDLSRVTQKITSATLALTVHNQPPGYNSSDLSESYELHDVSTPIALLVTGNGGLAAHADLGTGSVYGRRKITAADKGSIIEIALNSSAIAEMNASDGLFGIGGSLTTLDDLPNTEFIFGGSHLLNPRSVSQLRLTLVPEPSSLLLCLAGIIAAQLRRNRRRPRRS